MLTAEERAANDELRRLIVAGPPRDGNQLPLWKALHRARPLVALGMQNRQFFALSMPFEGKMAPMAFTHEELASTLRPPIAVLWKACRLKDLCQHALAVGAPAVAIDPGAHGYRLDRPGMTALINGLAYGSGGQMTVLEPIQSWVGQPRVPPPANVWAEWQRAAREIGIRGAKFGGMRLGKMPLQYVIAYPPPRNVEFERQCWAALERNAGTGTDLIFQGPFHGGNGRPLLPEEA